MSYRRVLSVIAVLGLAVIFLIRLNGIDDRPLSRDEYYSATAVQRILETGAPAFHEGGYYPRALPLQYVNAAICKILGEDEASHRLLAVVFSVLSIPFLFLLARKFVPWQMALAVTFIFALSSWQTEFSRFARMYSALQFTTLLFFYAYYRVFREGSRRWTLVPYLAICFAITLHDLGILLIPFLLVAPWVGGEERAKPAKGAIARNLAAATMVGIFGLGWRKFSSVIWDSGVSNQYPQGWEPEGKYGLADKLQDSFSIPGIPWMAAFALFAVLLGGTWLVTLFRTRDQLEKAEVPLALATAIIAALFHQLALAGLAAGFLVWRNLSPSFYLKNPRILIGLAVIGVIGVIWLGSAFVFPGILEAVDAKSRSEALRLTFFAFPDLHRPTISPWTKWVPKITLLLAAGIALELWRMRNLPWSKLVWSPFWALAYFALVFGTVPTELTTTRYWFFLYPLMILTAGCGFYSLVSQLGGRLEPVAQAWIAAVVLFVPFLFTDDFFLKPLADPSNPNVIYRTGPFRKMSDHWYPRLDERSPGKVLSEQWEEGKTVVIPGVMSVSAYYIDDKIDPIMFMPRDEDERYRRQSRKGGTINNWSGFRLAGDLEELRTLTSKSENVLFSHILDEGFQSTPEEIWGDRIRSVEKIALSDDGRIETFSVMLRKAP